MQKRGEPLAAADVEPLRAGAPRYCFADIVAVDSDIITLLGPDSAAAVLHGSPRERRDGFLRAVAAAVPADPTDSDLLAALPSEVLYSVVRGRQR